MAKSTKKKKTKKSKTDASETLDCLLEVHQLQKVLLAKLKKELKQKQ